jgi:ubiquinone/menaquinone biosynthesis C-methylase UbiE
MEPFLRRMRIGKAVKEIKNVPNCILLDIGCGFNYKFLSSIEPYIAQGTGIDFKVAPVSSGRIRTIQTKLNETLPFEDNSFDIVTMLAVLEHLEKPKEIVLEIARVLKKGGKLVLTVPGKRAKPVLEYLAFKLGIVSEAEIQDHKKYYDFIEIKELVEQVSTLEIIKHGQFQLGMNNFCVIVKK